MKPQDIIVLIKLNIWNQGRWRIVPLAESICLSKTETHQAIRRLKEAGLYDEVLESPRKGAMQEFIIHGIKYCFPAELGATTRGLATAHSSPFLKDKIVGGEDSYVWPYAEGKQRGLALKPLYKTAPDAAMADRRLYHYLALIDALRAGKMREQLIAKDELVKLIKMGSEYAI